MFLSKNNAKKSEENEPVLIKNKDPQIFKVDEKNKQLMRLFRKFLKARFTRIYGSRQYSWTQYTRRIETKTFFTMTFGIEEINSDFYNRNELFFYGLIHNSLRSYHASKL